MELKNCGEYGVEIEHMDLSGRNFEISIQGIESEKNRIVNVRDD